MQLKPDFTEYFDKLISDFEARDTNNQILWLDLPWSKMKNKIFTQGHPYGIKLYQAGETAILASGAEFLESIAIGIK